jgi:hypothetical protein
MKKLILFSTILSLSISAIAPAFAFKPPETGAPKTTTGSATR